MALKLNVNRMYTFKYVEPADEVAEGVEPESFSLTFDFPFNEDLNRLKLRKQLEIKYGKNLDVKDDEENIIELKVKDKKGNDKIEKLSQREMALLTDMSDLVMRQSLIACEDVMDEEGNIVSITDSEGKVIEQNQKAVYDYATKKADLYTDILTAYLGTKSKNVKTGVTPQ